MTCNPGMDQHPPSLPAFGRDAPGPQWTYPTHRPVELEGLQSIDTTGAISPLSRRHDGAGNLPRRTGATARGQVKVKVIFGKVFPVGPARRFGHQPAFRVGEGLAGPAVPIGGVAHGFLHHRAGTRFALLHQFQDPQIVGSVARQHFHGGDQLAVGVHHDGRLVPVAQLRVMHRQHPVLAHPIPDAHPYAVPICGCVALLDGSSPGSSR